MQTILLKICSLLRKMRSSLERALVNFLIENQKMSEYDSDYKNRQPLDSPIRMLMNYYGLKYLQRFYVVRSNGPICDQSGEYAKFNFAPTGLKCNCDCINTYEILQDLLYHRASTITTFSI